MFDRVILYAISNILLVKQLWESNLHKIYSRHQNVRYMYCHKSANSQNAQKYYVLKYV